MDMKIIVTSRKNLASKNMHELFVKEFGFRENGARFDGMPVFEKDDFVLINCEKQILELEYLSEHFSPELYIVASTHKSAQGVKSLSCHCTGNWGRAMFGGRDGEIALGQAFVLRNAFLLLQEQKIKHSELSAFDVVMEVTHHGPSFLNAPSLWVEVGGTDVEWNDMVACRAACEVILSCSQVNDEQLIVAVGFGGTHYAPSFVMPYILEKVAFAHICPKHAIDSASDDVILQAFAQTLPKATHALIDWKGTSGAQRERLLALFAKNGIAWLRREQLK